VLTSLVLVLTLSATTFPSSASASATTGGGNALPATASSPVDTESLVSIVPTAFGAEKSATGDVAVTRFLFAGEYRDDSGLYYLRARFLDPGSGLFLTVDPAVFTTSMPYAYTTGDPYQQTDPLGLMPSDTESSGQSVLGGIVTGIGNVVGGVAYGLNPFNWDDIYQNVRCGALSDGWVASITMNLNPMYGVVANVDAAIGAAQDGRYGDMAESATEAVGATALTVLGAKVIVTKYLPRVTTAVKGATAKLPGVKTATEAGNAAKQGVGTQGAGKTGTSAGGASASALKSPGVSAAPVADRVVIGKMRDIQAPGALGHGERTLIDQLPNQGNEVANWAQNERVLLREMESGRPIRDATVDPLTGEWLDDTGFLWAERSALAGRGWNYDTATHLWSPGG
jgi:RHS repeat-associated protein